MDHDFGIFLQRAAVLAEELEICYCEKQKRSRHEVSALEKPRHRLNFDRCEPLCCMLNSSMVTKK